MTGKTRDIEKVWGGGKTVHNGRLCGLTGRTSPATQLCASGNGTSRPVAARVDKHKAIERISEPFRTILALTDVNGLSMSEAASLMGCEPTVLYWKVLEGRRQLYKVIAMNRGSHEQGET
jgi:hypothetical protein